MADYNPNQFTPEVGQAQRQARGEHTQNSFIYTPTTAEVERLKRELEELRAEVKRLKGVQTYTIDIYQTSRYRVEASSEEEARERVLDEHGLIEPLWKEITEITIEQS